MNFRNNARRLFVVIAMAFAILNSVGYAQPDVYLSFSAFGDGDAVNNTSSAGPVSAYIWVDENFSIDTSACFSIVRSGDPTVDIIGVEVFNPDIVDQNTGQTVPRWQAVSVGPVLPDSVVDICGTAVGGGTGILPSQITGSALVDSLHDETSQAFLFARVDLVVVGVVGFGTTNLEIVSGVVMNGGSTVVPSYGSVTITLSTFFGDVNLDGLVSLGDVAPFINLIFSTVYQAEGDINMDGFVNVHDIPPFIVILTGG